MNDFDLETKLKTARVPERPASYWEDFPSRIRVQLRRHSGGSGGHCERRFSLGWAYGLGIAAAVLLVCVHYHPLQATGMAVAKNKLHFQQQIARLDTALHRLMLNTDGMAYLLTEPN